MLARKENPRSNILAPSKLKLFPQSRNSLEKGFEKFVGKTPSYTCMKHALKCKSMFTLKATRELPDNKKLSNLPITPIKSLFLRFHMLAFQPRRSRGCFVHVTFLANKIETERDGKPPLVTFVYQHWEKSSALNNSCTGMETSLENINQLQWAK